MSHGVAVLMLQVFCPFASSSLMSNAKPRARSGVVFFPPLPRPPTCLPAWIFYQWSCEDESEVRGRNCGVCVSVMFRTMFLWLWCHQCNIKHTLRLLKMPSTSSRIHGNKSNHMYLMLSIAVLVANSWCNRYQISMSRPYVQAKWQLYRHIYIYICVPHVIRFQFWAEWCCTTVHSCAGQCTKDASWWCFWAEEWHCKECGRRTWEGQFSLFLSDSNQFCFTWQQFEDAFSSPTLDGVMEENDDVDLSIPDTIKS